MTSKLLLTFKEISNLISALILDDVVEVDELIDCACCTPQQ